MGFELILSVFSESRKPNKTFNPVRKNTLTGTSPFPVFVPTLRAGYHKNRKQVGPVNSALGYGGEDISYIVGFIERYSSLKKLRIVFEVWGYISALIAFGVIVSIFIHFDKPEKIDEASYGDVKVSLNWSQLGAERFESVLHSYESPILSLDGDFAKVYVIKVTEVPDGFYDNVFSDWKTLPLENEILKDGLDLALSAGSKRSSKWLPTVDMLVSPRYMVNFNRLTYYGDHSEYASVFIIDNQEKYLYHFVHKI